MIKECRSDHMISKLRLEYEMGTHGKDTGKNEGGEVKGEEKEWERPEAEELSILKK